MSSRGQHARPVRLFWWVVAAGVAGFVLAAAAGALGALLVTR